MSKYYFVYSEGLDKNNVATTYNYGIVEIVDNINYSTFLTEIEESQLKALKQINKNVVECKIVSLNKV